MMKLNKTLGAAALFLAVFGCETDQEIQDLQRVDDAPLFTELPANAYGRESGRSNYAVFTAEYLATGESGHIGRTVYFKDVGNKELTADFVPGASLDGTDAISFYIDPKRPSRDLNVGVTTAAISRAMATWENVSCSDLGLYQVPSSKKVTTGFISAAYGFRGSYDYVADVVHAGWLGADFFDLIAPEGSTYILGVTFTIIFTDDAGNPTDIDQNGKLDVAWREIYYNDAFSWADGAHYDVETIALHEAGHGLSQGHFGSAFADAGTGALHFSPRAVMNAAYSGIQTQIGETDNAGHCTNWAEWPAN